MRSAVGSSSHGSLASAPVGLEWPLKAQAGLDIGWWLTTAMLQLPSELSLLGLWWRYLKVWRVFRLPYLCSCRAKMPCQLDLKRVVRWCRHPAWPANLERQKLPCAAFASVWVLRSHFWRFGCIWRQHLWLCWGSPRQTVQTDVGYLFVLYAQGSNTRWEASCRAWPSTFHLRCCRVRSPTLLCSGTKSMLLQIFPVAAQERTTAVFDPMVRSRQGFGRVEIRVRSNWRAGEEDFQ